MKRVAIIAVFIFAVSMLSGCVYTNIKAPMPELSTPLSDAPGAKTGKASCMSYVWVVMVGDCSVNAAMNDGGIQKINHVDTEIVRVLMGLYGRTTTVVYGN